MPYHSAQTKLREKPAEEGQNPTIAMSSSSPRSMGYQWDLQRPHQAGPWHPIRRKDCSVAEHRSERTRTTIAISQIQYALFGVLSVM
jgi:hypothetical protein